MCISSVKMGFCYFGGFGFAMVNLGFRKRLDLFSGFGDLSRVSVGLLILSSSGTVFGFGFLSSLLWSLAETSHR